MKTLVALLFLSVILLCSCSHQYSSEETGYLPRIKEEKNPHNVQFGMEECVPLCDVCAEINNRVPNSSKTRAFHFKVSNLPEDKKFIIFDRFGKPVPFPIYAHNDELILDVNNQSCSFFSLCSVHLFENRKGESFDYYLISLDKSTCVRATTVPNPIEATGSDGASVSAIFLDLDQAKNFSIEGKNFVPNEQVTLVASSYNEVLSKQISLSEKGEFLMTISPAVIGKKEGVAQFEIIRDNEKLTLEIPWGQKDTRLRSEKELFANVSCVTINPGKEEKECIFFFPNDKPNKKN